MPIALSIDTTCLLFFVALSAGFIDSIAGGGGLIALPALILSGIPPAFALGTNKLQALIGKASSVEFFLKKGILDFKQFKYAFIVCIIFSSLGAFSVRFIPTDDLLIFLPWLLVLAAAYFLFSPRLSDIDSSCRLSLGAYTLLVLPFIAFYDGFLGPASSSILIVSLIALQGFNTVKALAHARLLLMVGNCAAVAVFIQCDCIMWQLGLVMGVGQWIGARAGSEVAFLNGSRLIKPLLISVCILMLGKLAYNSLTQHAV